jgi:hypothetical protein
MDDPAGAMIAAKEARKDLYYKICNNKINI